MTALNRTPENGNFLQPTKFLLSFRRIPNVQYFCQEVNIPSVTLGEAARNTPGIDLYYAGTKLQFGSFSVTFALDEYMYSWKNLYDWLRGIASPTDFEERKRYLQERKNYQDQYTDATLTVLSNLNNPILRFDFINIFPTDLGEVRFDTKESAETIITVEARFRYESFSLTKI